MAVYQIPQKTQREDKILGPLTIRDMLVAGGTAIVGYFSFTEINRNPLLTFTIEETIFISVVIILLGTAWTFAKIDEKPLEVWVMYLIHFVKTPKVMYWEKLGHEESIFAEEILETAPEKTDEPQKEVKDMANKMDVLSQYLDAPEGAFSSDETKDVLGIWQEDSTITAMKEHLEQEKNQKVQEQFINSPERNAMQSVITEAAEQNASMQGSQVLAKPEGGLKGFFAQATRSITSGFMDAFQTKHTQETVEMDTAPAALSEKEQASFRSSVMQSTSPSAASDSAKAPQPLEGFAASPDQLLEELRKTSLNTSPGASSATDASSAKTSTDHVKILSDAELSES